MADRFGGFVPDRKKKPNQSIETSPAPNQSTPTPSSAGGSAPSTKFGGLTGGSLSSLPPKVVPQPALGGGPSRQPPIMSQEPGGGRQDPTFQNVAPIPGSGQLGDAAFLEGFGFGGGDPRDLPVNEGAALAAGQILGGASLVAGFEGAWNSIKAWRAAKAAAASTAVSDSLVVGTVADAASMSSTAATFAANSKTVAQTSSWLTKAGSTAGVSTAATAALIPIIGSYPFAGFIQEEALQTLSFGVKTALGNGDIEGAQAAIALQHEILNPDLWDQILAGIPFANVVTELRAFTEAARAKLVIDENLMNNMRLKNENGETDTQMYARIAQEKIDAAALASEVFRDERAEMLRLEKSNRDAERIETANFWRAEAEKKRLEEIKQREEDNAYWDEYYKELGQTSDRTPSNLKFGGLF